MLKKLLSFTLMCSLIFMFSIQPLAVGPNSRIVANQNIGQKP